MRKDLALVYMAAGISRRFGGRIKGLVEVGPRGETLIDYSLGQSLPAGFTRIVFVVSSQTAVAFQKHFGETFRGRRVFYAVQEYDSRTRDKPWGTADALCSAKQFLNCPFVVCNGDDLYGSRAFSTLANHLRKSDDSAAIGYRLADNVPERGEVNRGVFRVNADGYVIDIKEVLSIAKDTISEKGLNNGDLCSMNIFALHPNVADLLSESVSAFKNMHAQDRTSECYLPIEICSLISNGSIKMKLHLTNDKCMGITNPGDEVFLRQAFLTA